MFAVVAVWTIAVLPGPVDPSLVQQFQQAVAPYVQPSGIITAEYELPGALSGGVVAFAYEPSTGAFLRIQNGGYILRKPNGSGRVAEAGARGRPWARGEEKQAEIMTLFEYLPQVLARAIAASPDTIEKITLGQDQIFKLDVTLDMAYRPVPVAATPKGESESTQSCTIGIDRGGRVRSLKFKSFQREFTYGDGLPEGFALAQIATDGALVLRAFAVRDSASSMLFDDDGARNWANSLAPPNASASSLVRTIHDQPRPVAAFSAGGGSSTSTALIVAGSACVLLGILAYWRMARR